MRPEQEIRARLAIVERLLETLPENDDEYVEFDTERSTLRWVLGEKLGN
jgi:hypothetical protein